MGKPIGRLRQLLGLEPDHSSGLSPFFPSEIVPAPFLKNVWSKVEDIPGWFNYDDSVHFQIILSMQSLMGISGDLFEIGSFYGRSTAVMATLLCPGETIHVCDAFQSQVEDHYGKQPTVEELRSNIQRVAPEVEPDRVIIYNCLSSELEIDGNPRFRFAHIDGGHSAECVHHDLTLTTRYMQPHGVIAVDDYRHRDWPGVTVGVDRFLDEHDEFSVVADVNRQGAKGRKLYLIHTPDADG